jgi:two-component system phosphate regulon sensor histidine kinase PhoR
MDLSFRTRLVLGLAAVAVGALISLVAILAGVARLEPGLVLVAGLAVAALFLVGLAGVSWIGGRQTARLRDLSAVAGRVGAGERGARALEQPADEVGRLGRAINDMAAELHARLSALEQQRDERERILAHMSDGVALIDHEGRFVHANHRLAALLGAPRPPDPGTTVADYVRVPDLHELIRGARERGHTIEVEARLWSPRPGLLRATATPIGPTGHEATLLVLHDLTEIEQLNRVRQDFVANVSHELRTPLTSLRGYAETLLDGGLEDVEHREGFVRTIRDQAVRLSALVEDLLSLAELERPGAGLRSDRFDLREVVEQQVATVRPRAERSGLELALDPGPPVEVTADRVRIEQVVANLLDNATKYTEQGHVRARVGAAGPVVWCEIEDTGPGIPLEDQPRIFERFYRVDKARAREKGGTGLGLSIVKHVVALHGGTLAVKSRPAEGSTFRFEIPKHALGGRQPAHGLEPSTRR